MAMSKGYCFCQVYSPLRDNAAVVEPLGDRLDARDQSTDLSLMGINIRDVPSPK